MKLNRPLIAAVYAVAAFMILVPLIEVTLSVWPLRFNQTAWRFGTFGLISQSIMTPLLGIVLLVASAVLLDHRRTLHMSAVFVSLIALLLVAGLPLFALDAIQMRVQVRAEALRAFHFSSTMAAVKMTAALMVVVLLAIGAWKAARSSTKRAPAREQDTPPLLARRPG